MQHKFAKSNSCQKTRDVSVGAEFVTETGALLPGLLQSTQCAATGKLLIKLEKMRWT